MKIPKNYLEAFPNLQSPGWEVCDEHLSFGTINFHKWIETPETIANYCRARICLVLYPQHVRYFVEVRRTSGHVASKDIAQGGNHYFPNLEADALAAVPEIVAQATEQYREWAEKVDREYERIQHGQ